MRKPTALTQTVRSRRRETAPEWSDSSLEHRHVSRRTDLGIVGSDALEVDLVVKPCRDRLRPAAEVVAVPFESVVGMTELTSRKRTETHVVFGVRGRERDDPRRGELEHRPLECNQTLRVKMLDHLDHSRPIEPRQPAVPIAQGAVE